MIGFLKLFFPYLLVCKYYAHLKEALEMKLIAITYWNICCFRNAQGIVALLSAMLCFVCLLFALFWFLLLVMERVLTRPQNPLEKVSPGEKKPKNEENSGHPVRDF